jgi:hypothetical protein
VVDSSDREHGEREILTKDPLTVFLVAGASGGESAPTVLQFFEQVNFPGGIDARGFKAACMELARRMAVGERTRENNTWPRFDAEKFWGNLEVWVSSNKVTNMPFGLPVTYAGLSQQNAGVLPKFAARCEHLPGKLGVPFQLLDSSCAMLQN